MAIGMTFDQFWYGDVRMTRAFVEADILRQKRMNNEAWLQGMYFYDALCCALQNAFRKKSDPPVKYPEKPYGISEQEADKQKPQDPEEAERLKAKLYMHQLKWATQDCGGS